MADRPTNLLLITSDQQHYDTLGVSNPRIQTPALDRLAGEGARFTRAYTVNPVCSPARSTLITGLFPAWHHCWTIGVKLPEDVPTIGDMLHDAGYATGLIGKAHFQPLASQPGSESLECQPTLRDLDFWRSFQGPWYGFRHVEVARNHADESHAGQHYAIWMEEKGLRNWRDYFAPWPPEPGATKAWRTGLDGSTWTLPEEMHYTTWTGERTAAFIENCHKREQPFFAWASFHDPHPPYLAPEPWASMYNPDDMQPGRLSPGEHDDMPPQFGKTQEDNPDFSMYREPGGHDCHGFCRQTTAEQTTRRNMATYYGMISFMDREIGRILDSLDRLGIADNTLVLFTTDHGHFLGQHGLVAKGAFHYEDMIRVPFLARHPGVIPAGVVNNDVQSLIDVPPTLLAAAGIKPPGAMQGLDQTEAWTGRRQAPRRHALVENRHQPTRIHLRTLVNQRYKITVYRDADYGELFDLEADPAELHNLWNDPAASAVKQKMLLEFVQAEIQREPTRMPRIACA